MNPKLNQTIPTLILTVLIILLRIPIYFSQNNLQNQTCRRPFVCGNIREIGYPFWGDNRPESCGYPGFELHCRDNIFRLNISSITYRVLDIEATTQTLRVTRDDLSNTLCPPFLINTTLNSTLFDFSSTANDQNITLHYGCNTNGPPPTPPIAASQFSCNVNGSSTWGFYLTRDTSELRNNSVICNSSIHVPVSRFAAQALTGPTGPTNTRTNILQDAIARGFSIQWSVNNDCHNCVSSGGLCEHNNQGPRTFRCYCTDGPHNFT